MKSRREFLATLAALPFVGKLIKHAPTSRKWSAAEIVRAFDVPADHPLVYDLLDDEQAMAYGDVVKERLLELSRRTGIPAWRL